MIENKCDNCKMKPVCKFSKAYTADRRNLLDAGAALPLLGGKTTVLTITCKNFEATEAAKRANLDEQMRRFSEALRKIGTVAEVTPPPTDKDGGGQQ